MRVLVVHAHPDATSFNRAVLDAALTGLGAAGHEVRVRDLYAEGFEPRLSRAEKRGHLSPPESKPHLAEHFADLRWCEALVFVHPTWWGAQPAMIKGWIDRVWARGVAWELPEGAKRLKPTLHNVRRIVTFTTHGSPWRINALQGVPGRRIVNRSLRVICHPLCRTRWVALYSLDASDSADRERFLRRVRRVATRL
ncbi:MAG: NAD(P)H-dependent oxidoreductase [Actinomycetota bacterium]